MQLFGNESEYSFEELALEVFHYQAEKNMVYAEYLNLIACDIAAIDAISQIPLMPISFYKHREVVTGVWEAEQVFLSSGTGNSIRSKHYLRSADWYKKISRNIAKQAALNLPGSEVVGLLPNYLENGQSSLVHMVNDFIKLSNTPPPFFFLHDNEGLYEKLNELLDTTQGPVILFGVTFALLDFAQLYKLDSSRLIVIYTGGMKNKGEELLPQTIITRLQKAFPHAQIRSEYGMTELLSQAYAAEDARYTMPATLRILTKQINDPFSNSKKGKTGIIGAIDLANVDTLSFILTQDLGRVYDDQTFEVMGRMTDSDLRGCNLLYRPY